MTESTRAAGTVAAARVDRGSARLFALALVLGLGARLVFGHSAPLWFDESFSGTIATQPDLASLVRWCRTELTGPGYYLPLWLWVRVTGDSDILLRLPSLMLSFAAPLLLWRWGHPDPAVRRAWAGAALLWLPIVGYANLARPYAELFFLGCAQAVLFRRMLVCSDLRRALAWSCVTALMILTHYSVLPLVGAQMVVLIVVLRRATPRLWPALMLQLPVMAWAAFHFPFVMALAGAGGGSSAQSLGDWIMLPELLFGVQGVGLLVLGCVGATAVLPVFRHADEAGMAQPDRALAGTGIVATLMILAAGATHGGVTARYLTGVVPSLLFALALWVRWSVRIDPRPAIGVATAMIAGTLGLIVSSAVGRGEDVQHRFGLEPASAWLAAERPATLAFLWSDPLGARSADHNIADVAGLAFRRLGRPVTVAMVHPVPGQNPGATLLARADQAGATAILWMAKVEVADQPVPQLEGLDRRWECRDFGDTTVRALACRRPRLSPRARPGPSTHWR